MNDNKKDIPDLVGTIPITLDSRAEKDTTDGFWKEIIAGCINGERGAQEKLYKKLYGKMMAMGMRYLSDKDDALEAVNSGFLKVFQRLGQYSGNGAFEGWVYSIIRNAVIDHLRSRVRYKETESLEVAYDSSIPQSAIQDLYVKDLMKMLNLLPETTRLVFNMFAIDGYKHEEIAEMLGISAGTSKWHVSEARSRLKELILKQSGEDRIQEERRNKQ